jgi:hypothetical protein
LRDVQLTFLGTTGVQALSASTSLSTTTYPIVGVRGFGQSGPTPVICYVSEAYLQDIAGTWYGKMSGQNVSGVDVTYNLYYFYKQ